MPKQSRFSQMLDLSDYELLKYSRLFRQISVFWTSLFTASMSDEEVNNKNQRKELVKANLEVNPLSYQQKKALTIESLESQKRILQVEAKELEVLIQAVKSDISQIEVQVTQLDFIINHMKNS
jgi:hypothetical protein